jgi:hypothetical protein
MSKKKVIDILDDLYHSGDLKHLVNEGTIQSSILMYRNIYHAFNFRHDATGSKMQAMKEVALNFNISVSLVEKVRRKLGK